MRRRIRECHHALQAPQHIARTLWQSHRELIERAPRVTARKVSLVLAAAQQAPCGRERLSLGERQRALVPGGQIISAIAAAFHLDGNAAFTKGQHITSYRTLVYLQPTSQLLATHATM